MSNPLTDLELRFSDVVLAIETTPKSLRKWLQSGKLQLDSDSQKGWRNFSAYDLAILAIMRKLVDFGISVQEASKIAKINIRGIPGVYDPALIMAGPTHMLPDSLEGQFLEVAAQGSNWYAWTTDEPKGKDSYLDAKLVLNLGRIVGRAFERVAERGNQSERAAK